MNQVCALTLSIPIELRTAYHVGSTDDAVWTNGSQNDMLPNDLSHPLLLSLPAGKSYTMRWLASAGIFPLDRFVVVNPDVIKSRLPEMPHFIAANRALAGSLTHKESGYICEIIERQAAALSKNILIDGSLRNADWHESMLKRLRASYPNYRIAILLVTADAERIYERAERRAKVTGREIPRPVLDEAIQQVPRAFERVAPLADYTAVITNNDNRAPPVFLPPAELDAFAQLWRDSAAEDGHDLPAENSSTHLMDEPEHHHHHQQAQVHPLGNARTCEQQAQQDHNSKCNSDGATQQQHAKAASNGAFLGVGSPSNNSGVESNIKPSGVAFSAPGSRFEALAVDNQFVVCLELILWCQMLPSTARLNADQSASLAVSSSD